MSADPSKDRLVISGRVHLSLHAVAACFDVQVTWIEAVYQQGLLGACRQHEGQVAVAASQLDRVARIVRLHFHQGIELTGIVVLLGIDAADSDED